MKEGERGGETRRRMSTSNVNKVENGIRKEGGRRKEKSVEQKEKTV